VVPSNATIADNYAYLFVARNCRKVSGQHLDETEYLNVVKITEQELESMVEKGEFQQVVHIAAWLLAKRK
jgi:ADP-ribose pyrophosphatase